MEPNTIPPAPQLYGRACLNCSRSKCRCVTRPDGLGCERCHRLNKSCLPGNLVRRHNARPNNPVARIAQLEGKIDDIVSLLGAGRGPNAPRLDADHPSPSPESSPTPPGPMAATGIPAVLPDSPFEAFDPSPDEVDECVGYFRNHMIKFFPFLYLPADVQLLRRERPFLFLCVIATASKSTQRKRTLHARIKETLAQRIVLSPNCGGINIDLLLGLLTFVAWGNDQLLNGTPTSLSRFTQMAMGLVFELRLNKPAPADTNMLPADGYTAGTSTPSTPAGSLEERRAVLGCFVMSSIVSAYFSQIDVMQWTPYMDECLELLSKSRASPFDELFIQQVRLQLVAEQVEKAKGTTVPPAFYLKDLRFKANEIKANLPPHLQQDETLLASVYYAELSIFGIAISRETPSLERVESLYACLNTTKSALDNFFRLSLDDYQAASFTYFTHFARNIVVLFNLSTLKDQTWDTNLVRSTVDLVQVLDRFIGNMQHVRAAEGDRAADGALDRLLRIFNAVRSWCALRLGDGTEMGVTGNGGWHGAGDAGVLLEPMPPADMWLRDMFSFGSLEGYDQFRMI